MLEIIIDSERQKTYAKSLIDQMQIDGSDTVITKKTPKDATYKQQKLWFLWCGEVANSGLGRDDNTSDVHIRAKWKFVRPILLEENEIFGIIYDSFMKTINGSIVKPELCRTFSDEYIHTNSLTRKGRIKSLNEFEKFWCIDNGVNLTDPSTIGLNLKRAKK